MAELVEGDVDDLVESQRSRRPPGLRCPPPSPEPVVTGHLPDAGSVLLRSAVDLQVFRREVQTDRDGAFRMQIFPGRFTPVAFVAGRTRAVNASVVVSTSTQLRLSSGPREAAVRGRGRIDGCTVPITPNQTGPRLVDEEFAGGAPFSDTYGTDAQGASFSGTHLPAGKYRVADLDGSVPVQDGPWHYLVQHETFDLTPDRITDIGDVRLQIVD